MGFFPTSGRLVEHCIDKSFELARENALAYYKLWQAGNLDFLYFLLKPYMKPFIEALSVRNRYGEGAFMKILHKVQ